MNRNVSVAAVDRLIAMAEDEKPNGEKPASDLPEAGRGSETMAMLPDPMRGLEDNAMLKTLLQFRMMMPYLSRMMEPQGEGDSAMAGLSAELKQSVGDLQLTQRDLRMTVQEQLVQMKRVEEEMHRMREATEKNTFESVELTLDMKSVHSLVVKAVSVLGAVLAVLIGFAVYLVVRTPH
jgi:hypothetical protein